MKATAPEKAKRKKHVGYTEWQIRRLRCRLLSYRILSSTDGVYYSMLNIAQDIEEFLGEGKDFVPLSEGGLKDRLFTIKQERLRIFLAGGLLEHDKLVIIKKFLIKEGFLTEDEFKEADNSREFLATFRFIGSTNDLAAFRLKRIPTELVATRDQGRATASLQLQIQLDPSGLFFRAVETYSNQFTAGAPFDDVVYDKDGLVSGRYSRFGYGMTVTDSSRIQIYLRGEGPERNVTYIEVNARSLNTAHDHTLFVRYGDSTGLPVQDLSGVHEVVYDLNIFDFQPVGKHGKPEKKK